LKHPLSLPWRALAGCVIAALSARPARGQASRKLELHVIDSVSGAPVERAEVRVLKTIKDTAGWMIRITTDSSGRAIVTAPYDEQLLMMVRRLGFESSFFPVSASDGDDVLVIALAPAAVHLAATVTRAKATNQALTEVGFYERQRIRPGVFLDSAAIAKLKPIDFIAVIRQYLTPCTMIYMNGLPLLYLRDVDIRRVVGIEVYASNQQAPPQFSNSMDSEHRCGTIVVWQGF
jgi:5-hydroxyisourate hydrolase-like protein (transthyretin family)